MTKFIKLEDAKNVLDRLNYYFDSDAALEHTKSILDSIPTIEQPLTQSYIEGVIKDMENQYYEDLKNNPFSMSVA